MFVLSVDLIGYQIISDAETVLECYDSSVKTLLPRNSIALRGTVFRAAHLNMSTIPDSTNIVILPYSLHTIFSFGNVKLSGLRSLAFEFGSELSSVGSSTFGQISATAIFIPQSVRFMGASAISESRSIAYIHFDPDSSVGQFKSKMFSCLSRLSVIKIPASVIRIHDSAFSECNRLRSVAFELPSHCLSIASLAFKNCRSLDSVFLPPSVEVIDQAFSEPSLHIPRYYVPDNVNFCVENDCLTNGRELIQYQGSSDTFCVSRDITTLFPASFVGKSALTTLTFEPQSRLKSLPNYCCFSCLTLCSVSIPRSVRIIGERCFEKCSQLMEVAFEPPSSIHTIKCAAFSHCPLLTDFTFPSSVSTLGSSVFCGCSGLSSVLFETPSHLTSIPAQLFRACDRLKAVTLPSSVTTIHRLAFGDAVSISISGAHCAMGQFLFVRLGTVLRCLGEPANLRIPAAVLVIGESAFSHAYSIRELSFEEGVMRIGASAFSHCKSLSRAAFPASLEVIEKEAFSCTSLRVVTFAAGSKLGTIGEEAFMYAPLQEMVLPAGIAEIDPSAFTQPVWEMVTWTGPPLAIVRSDFLCSPDSKTLLRALAEDDPLVIPAYVEVIGRRAFALSLCTEIRFENGTMLREIGEGAFFKLEELKSVSVPSSVETIGDGSFEDSSQLKTITFDDSSRLKRIGEHAFSNCALTSIIIPASTEEIDGSAFVGCPIREIRIAGGSHNFLVERGLLTTADGRRIVRYFGRARDVTVSREVEVVGKSCFESCSHIENIFFESGSELRQIGSSALSGCEFLTSITIPASVEIVGESAFKKCNGLEECLMAEDAILVGIGKEAFADCCSLRWFYVPKSVQSIDEDCFSRCGCLHQLGFGSEETLKQIVRNEPLDDVLERIGFDEISSLFTIEVDDGEADLQFPGWVSDSDGGSTLVLIQADK
jgi:hypothetical protein